MNNMKSNKLEKTMVFFQSNKFLNAILELTIKSGFEDFVFRIVNKDYLDKRKLFFEQHSELIEKNIDLLYDEKSKKVYEGLILYRKYRKRKYFPYYSSKDQYFPEDVIKLNENEIFVDCGAFEGDTAQEFLKLVNSNYKKIVCFEPDKSNYEILLETLKNYDNVIAINKGVFDKKQVISFDSGRKGSSTISEEGSVQIEVDKIDDVPECNDVTFLKMDIEGSEPEALIGAQETIKRNKPKLAICIYHSDEDMINIIGQVHDLVPEYKIFVRQHSIYETETVLYCTL